MAKKSRVASATNVELHEELVAIKKLLVYGLRLKGASPASIGKTLGLGQSTVSEMTPGFKMPKKGDREDGS